VRRRLALWLALAGGLAGCGRGAAAPEPPARSVPGLETASVVVEELREEVLAAGVVVAEAETPALRDARAELETAQARQRAAAQQARRLEALADGVAPRKEVEAARAEEAAAAAAAERARLAFAAFGRRAHDDALPPGETWASARLLQRDVPRVEAGAAVRFAADAYPDHRFAGEVDAAPAYVDPETGVGPARVRLRDADRLLRPGMTGSLAIEVGAPHPALVVPAAAVVYDGARPLVFVEGEGGRFVERAVELGAAHDGRVEVRGELRAGARVATTGAASLLSAEQLPAAEAGAEGEAD